MNKLSKYIYAVGIVIILLSIIRWFIIWYDPSQAIMGSAIGIILLGFADIYNARKIVGGRLDKLDNRVDAIVKFYTKEEWK